MITSRDLRNNLEDIMYILTSDYAPDKWNAKNEISVAIYKEAKKVYKEADDAISLEDICWDYSSDEDHYVIADLMDKLSCELEMMEEDFDI